MIFPRTPIFQKLLNSGLFSFFTLCVDLIFCVSSWASNFIASRTRSATRSVGISNKILLSLVDPVLRTPLRGSTPLRSAQDDTRGKYGSSWAPTPTNCTNTALSTVKRTMCAKAFPSGKFFAELFFKKATWKSLTQTNSLQRYMEYL